jgi:hypothetical protein
VEGNDIYGILKRIGATHLHHANSVMTSCTFLEQGGLLGRGFVEDHGLKQSVQPSDELDKKYGIWHSIFLPHVDIHGQAGQIKGPNRYGPALFVLDLDVLLRLPAGSAVRVTKRSPAHWYDTEPESGRWFQTADEMAKNVRPDDFDKLVAIQTPLGRLAFPKRQARIILDAPQKQMSSGENAYTHAESRLKAAAAAGQVDVSIERRQCPMGCICPEKYAVWSTPVVDFYFG